MNFPPKNDFDLLYERMGELEKKLDTSNTLIDTLVDELRKEK